MADGSLRYEVAFDVKGLGETARVTRTIKDVDAAARSLRAQRINDLGLAAQAARAGEASRGLAGLSQATVSQGRAANAAAGEVKNLGGAISNLARLSGLGAIAESVQQVSSLRQAAGGAGGALGFMVKAAAPLAGTVAVAELLNAGIRRYGEYLDEATDKTIELAQATDKAFRAGLVGLQDGATEENRKESIQAVERRISELAQRRRDPGQSLRARDEMDAQMKVLNLQLDRLTEFRLPTEEESAAAKLKRSQAREIAQTEKTRGGMIAEFGAEQSVSRRREGLDLALAQTPDTIAGARQRVGLLQERQQEIAAGRERMEVNARSRVGSLEELRKAQDELASAMAEEASIRIRIVAENKTIADLTAKDEEARTKRREGLNKALRERSADEARRFGGGGPEVDPFARRGLSVVGGGGGNESLRWQQASAKALERLVALTAKMVAKPVGRTSTGWEE